MIASKQAAQANRSVKSEPALLQLGYRSFITFLVHGTLLAALPTTAAWAPDADEVLISETFYNPDGQEEGHEFVELHNTTSGAIDIAGWQFLTGITYVFPPAISIDANGYIVLA